MPIEANFIHFMAQIMFSTLLFVQVAESTGVVDLAETLVTIENHW